MRKYELGQEEKLTQVVCNKCAKIMRVENGYLKEGCLSVEKAFGYFSKKDGERHKFDLCEDCYDEMVAQFIVPVEKKSATELL